MTQDATEKDERAIRDLVATWMAASRTPMDRAAIPPRPISP